MKKFPIVVGMALGASVGLFTTISDGAGLKIVMMAIGIVAGAAIASAFARRSKMTGIALHEEDESFGQGISARDRLRNFWRDKGKTVRFMDPPDFGGTHRDFDQ